MVQRHIIAIGGPTASGKSALALDLARQTNGVIINADAMQVYAAAPILTAQPDQAAQKICPHRLYGFVDPAERFSVGKWLTAAKTAIEETLHAGLTPILIGGTGLYFKALFGGLADIPYIPAEITAEAETLYLQLGAEDFRTELAKLDPDSAARLLANDRQRLIRAYAVVRHTGKPIGAWHGADFGTKSELSIGGQTLAVEHHLVMPERKQLYAACDQRFLAMIKQGAIEEVKSLTAKNLDPGLPVMKILGVREIASYLNGETTLQGAIAKAQQFTRNYAKRQMTWFRHQWKFN